MLNKLAKQVLLLIFLWIAFSVYSDESNRPSFLGAELVKSYYDGKNNDLLTAGWKISELAQRKQYKKGSFTDPEWIRKVAYYNNTIALLDTTEAGGYGSLFGPKSGHNTISGYEYLAYSLDVHNQVDATLMLQIPDNMNKEKACILVAASSGSRGIYGAVGTVGTWALEKGCAVAYTDKGTGTGFYFHDTQKGFDIRGRYTNSKANLLTYKPEASNTQFLEKYPQAVSTKHAYSGKNIEKDSGKFVIQASEFALYQLNRHFSEQKIDTIFTKDNTMIIATSVSNGAAASLKAGELDQHDLIDGIVAAEPNITPIKNSQLSIIQGTKKIVKHSVPSYQYFVAQNLFVPCTLLTEAAQKQPFFNSRPETISELGDWCTSLKKDGFITGNSISELANNALQELTDLGIAANQQKLAPFFQAIELWPAIAATYANQIGRFNMEDQVCNIYFSAIDKNKNPIPLPESDRLGLAANSNGIPPTAGVALRSSNLQLSEYQHAKCFYLQAQSTRLVKGIKELEATTDLNGIPTIILHGRKDSLIAPNHSARPYYANAIKSYNKRQLNNRHSKSNIRYYEIKNAQHFDAFISLPQFSDDFIPLHYYFEQSLDLMFEHLQAGAELPPSQVIHTISKRQSIGGIRKLTMGQLPPITRNNKSLIELKINNSDFVLRIPD